MLDKAREAAVRTPASGGDGTYPRPQLVRPAWASLDREVGFAYDDALVGAEEHWERDSERFDRRLQLPFPPESDASGIGDTSYHACVWYRWALTASDLADAGHAPGRRLMLRFGAVDYEASVWVNGALVGTHEGGQTAFGVDITDALDAEASEQIVVVRAFDDPFDPRAPRGKQDWLPEPHVIWYHRTTGIWRSVWLESVPALHIVRVAWRGDTARSLVTATVELSARPASPVEVAVALAHGGRPLSGSVVTADDRLVRVTLDLETPGGGAHFGELLWSPERPTLLDAGVAVGDDVVASYCGLRDIAVSGAEVRLNDRTFYLRSVLEQGYWPASHLAAPSPRAIEEEVRLILELGFNSARIHQKVEDPRFHFWADKLGLTLWAETAAAYMFDSIAVQRLTSEWIEIVRAYESHPSIIAWVPFNESWGVLGIAHDVAQQAFARGLTDLTRALDPTRPVVSNDGWEHVNSDLLTVHDYEWRREVLARRYASREALLESPAPADRPLVVGGHEDAHRRTPILLTEFGGVRYRAGDDGDTWGYSSAQDASDFERRLRAIVEPVRASPILTGFCWTQLTDTLQEANGLCDEHRRPKLPAAVLRDLFGAQQEGPALP